MRVLKIFFTTLIILLFLSVLAGLVAREVLLMMGVSQLRADAKQLRSLQINPEFIQSCLEYGGKPSDGGSITQTQLRFISDTQYLLEVTCSGSASLRYTVREAQLPPLVSKQKSQSGLIDGLENQGVILSVLGRTGVVYEEELLVKSSLKVTANSEENFTAGPATSCGGYGFTCCDEAYQIGQGDQQPAALDCPRSCFMACVGKPTIINFSFAPTNEAFDPTLNLVSADDELEFFYTVSDLGSDDYAYASAVTNWWQQAGQLMQNLFGTKQQQDTVTKVVIDFGDGQTIELSDLQGSALHTYTCNRTLCVYTATIQVVTSEGLTSSLTGNSQLQIEVRP